MNFLKKLFSKTTPINVSTAKIDKQVYLMNYHDHYSNILNEHETPTILSELFLFRAWTAQFGYRIFSTDSDASEKLIGETVNSAMHLGVGIFEKVHGFSIEEVLGSDFLSLLDDRWGRYDVIISTLPKSDRIPTSEIIATLTGYLELSDPIVTVKLSTDFLSQLDFVKRTAMEIGVLS